MLKFNDGVVLQTEGEFRVEHLDDGWYVLGHGMSLPLLSKEEGDAFIQEYNDKWIVSQQKAR